MKDISHIRNVKTANELAKYYNDILAYARMKYENFSFIDDAVQDTMIKLITLLEKGKEINGGYIGVAINNVILDMKKYNNRFDLGTSDFEAVIPDKEDDFEDILREENKEESKYKQIMNLVDAMDYYDKRIIEYTSKMNYSEFEKLSGIPRKSISSRKKVLIEQIKSQIN
jgi:DNA-directed RNA polymerase specialized sigma24 family protein